MFIKILGGYNYIKGMNEDKEFVSKFRWTFAADNLPSYVAKDIFIDYHNKKITLHAYEVMDGADTVVDRWLAGLPENLSAVFTTYDEAGNMLYERKFDNLQVIEHSGNYDYADSGLAVRKIGLSW